MEAYKKELKKLLREYDVLQDEEMVDLAFAAYEIGCEAGEMKARGGFGERDDEDEDYDEEEEKLFRKMWSNGGFGERGYQGGNSGGSYSRSGGGYGNRRGVKGTGRYSRFRR